MLYTKIQLEAFLIQEKIFKCFLPYMGMAAILFNDAYPFEQIDSTPFDRRPNVKSDENLSN